MSKLASILKISLRYSHRTSIRSGFRSSRRSGLSISVRIVLNLLLVSGAFAFAPNLVYAADSADKPCLCMAADPNQQQKKHKKGPIHHVLKGLANEFGPDLSDMGKDAMFVFSARDFDPYDSKPASKPKRPYVAGEAEFVDGSHAEIVRFPDRSLRIYGSAMNGTYACPSTADSNTFDVYYPNGVSGQLVFLPSGGAEIRRPDKTVTRLTKTAAGTYEMRNSKLGYLGEINPDQTGLNYQFARSSNPVQ